ncbi:MAG: ATP-dependent Clp protease ATP-binding subunit [Spirochaetia bacterium]|jgi:ATP-dependent Clp protease ATP-binding subunit ClpA|nr:ATP-dependent Clp protease ATP-binding subunit [Spirochaetia bacterium]
MSRYDKYTETTLGILVKTQDIAMRGDSPETGYRDLAEALLLTALPEMVAIARKNNAILDEIRLGELNQRLESSVAKQASRPIKISGEFRGILDKAEELAGEAKVEPSHLIKAAWPTIKDELAPFFRPEVAPGLSIPSDEISLPEMAPSEVADDAASILAQFGRELTAGDQDFPIFGRQRDIDGLVSTLLKYYKPNPLLIGESGVGKTALVEGLAMRIKSGTVPDSLKKARIFEIRVSEILAGTNLHGALEENMNQLLAAAEAMDDVYLFIDEIHQVVPAFANNPISEILKPALSSGRIRCIGATTTADFSRYLEKDAALLRRFQTVLVKEPDDDTVRAILAGMAPRLQEHFAVAIPQTMLDRSFEIARRYLPMRRFPDKALDVLDRACARTAFNLEDTLTEARLLEAVKDIANVVAEPGLEEANGFAGLESRLSGSIIGQEKAIKAVAQAVRVAKMRLDLHQNRPDGAFLLTGPTGVGKTALALSLAKALSGRDDAIFRIDMSEFSDAHTAARLLGAPPGYIGYDDSPLLTRAVDTCSGGVLLLDELEKAHPQVHRLFLQILDAGSATDSSGRSLSFASITIVATCNVGSNQGTAVGFDQLSGAEADGRVPLAALKRAFPIELLNRFDAIIPFRGLNREDARRILQDIIIAGNNENLLREYGISLDFSPEAMDSILDQGFSREFGARNLHRAFRGMVSVPLAAVVQRLRGTGTVRVDEPDEVAEGYAADAVFPELRFSGVCNSRLDG